MVFDRFLTHQVTGKRLRTTFLSNQVGQSRHRPGFLLPVHAPPSPPHHTCWVQMSRCLVPGYTRHRHKIRVTERPLKDLIESKNGTIAVFTGRVLGVQRRLILIQTVLVEARKGRRKRKKMPVAWITRKVDGKSRTCRQLLPVMQLLGLQSYYPFSHKVPPATWTIRHH